MTLYRNKYNSLYYRVIQGRVSYSKDTIVWRPTVISTSDLSRNPNIFELVGPPSITLENK